MKEKIRNFLLTIFEFVLFKDLDDAFFGCCYVLLLVLVIMVLRWGN